MRFGIEFLNKVVDNNIRLGQLIIGDYKEVFESSMAYWSVNDYEQHWMQALEMLVQGSKKSCLITSMHDPQTADFLFWWPMYQIGESIYIQNQILFFEDISETFDPNKSYHFIPNRKIIGETGHPISEWSVSIREIENFLNI